MAYKKKSKKQRQRVDSAIVHVKSTFNNTLVSVSTMDGDNLLRSSSGKLGFKGARKGTPFAASQVGADIAKGLVALGIRDLEVNFSEGGAGREAVVRALQSFDMSIRVLRDVTPLPHNGCRPPKKRRV